jgi:hypothetical protein
VRHLLVAVCAMTFAGCHPGLSYTNGGFAEALVTAPTEDRPVVIAAGIETLLRSDSCELPEHFRVRTRPASA